MQEAQRVLILLVEQIIDVGEHAHLRVDIIGRSNIDGGVGLGDGGRKGLGIDVRPRADVENRAGKMKLVDRRPSV